MVIIIIMKLWPAPWSWYMYLGTRSARAAAPDLEAAEAELAAATRADGVVATEPRRALGRRRALDAGRAIHRERGVLDLELVAAAAPDAVEFSDIGRLGDIGYV